MTATISGGAYALARKALDEADGDWDAARDALMKAATRDKGLSAHLLKIGAYEAIRLSAHEYRAAAIRWPELTIDDPSETNGNGLEKGQSGETLANPDDMYALLSATLLDYPLAGGLKLRDATRKEVEREREFQAMMERESGIRRRWFDAISERLPDDKKTVGDLLKEADLRRLWEAAQSG